MFKNEHGTLKLLRIIMKCSCCQPSWIFLTLSTNHYEDGTSLHKIIPTSPISLFPSSSELQIFKNYFSSFFHLSSLILKWSSIWSYNCAAGTCKDVSNGGGGNGNFDEVTNDTNVTSMKFGVNILDDRYVDTGDCLHLQDMSSLIGETCIKQRKYYIRFYH